MVRSPIGCNKEDAIRYLGCSVTMFDNLTSRRIVRSLANGWYSYNMLDQAMQLIEKEAITRTGRKKKDDPKVINFKDHAKGQTVRSEGDRSSDGKEKELLFPDLAGGRGSKG